MEFVVWIGFAIAVGFWADSKGKNGTGWGLISVVISPLLSAIILFFVGIKDEEKAVLIRAEEAEAVRKDAQQKANETALNIKLTTVSVRDFVSELQKLFALKENDLLTADEFISKKVVLITSLATKKIQEDAPDFLTGLLTLVKCSAITSDEVSEIKKYIFK